MTSSLSPRSWFRKAQNLLEKSVASKPEKVVLEQSPALVRIIIWLMISTTGFGLAWLALAKTDEVVIAPGKLEPIGDVKTVQMPQGGVLKVMLVREGQKVSKGQLLLRLDSEASSDREKGLRASLAAKTQELALKKIELDKLLEANSAELTLAQQRISVDRLILKRLEKLATTGAAAELQVLEQRSKLHESEGRFATVSADRQRQTALLNQQTEALHAEIAELNARLTESKVSNRYQAISSPVDGVVFDLKPTGPGFVGQGSEPVMKIVPFNALKAKVEVESSKIGFVRVGQKVDLSIDSFPSSDFGVVHGVLARIGSDALAPDERKPTYRYPVEVKLTTQQLQLKSGKSLPLQVGMSLTANIKLRKVTYLQLLLSDFKDKTDSLKQI